MRRNVFQQQQQQQVQTPQQQQTQQRSTSPFAVRAVASTQMGNVFDQWQQKRLGADAGAYFVPDQTPQLVRNVEAQLGLIGVAAQGAQVARWSDGADKQLFLARLRNGRQLVGKGREWTELGVGPVAVAADLEGAGFWSSVSSAFSTAVSWTSSAAVTALDKAGTALDVAKDVSKAVVATGQSVVDFVAPAASLIPGGAAVVAGANQALSYGRTGNAMVEKLVGAGLGDGQAFRLGAGGAGSMALLKDGSLGVSASGDAFDFVPVQGGGAWVMLRHKATGQYVDVYDEEGEAAAKGELGAEPSVFERQAQGGQVVLRLLFSELYLGYNANSGWTVSEQPGSLEVLSSTAQTRGKTRRAQQVEGRGMEEEEAEEPLDEREQANQEMQALNDAIRNNELGAAEYLDKYIAIQKRLSQLY